MNLPRIDLKFQILEVKPLQIRLFIVISKEETQHIAKLARLGLGEAEIAKYQKELAAILGYADKLKEVDLEGVLPFTHSVATANVTRQDAAVERQAEDLEKLRSQFPDSKEGYLKVKSIF